VLFWMLIPAGPSESRLEIPLPIIPLPISPGLKPEKYYLTAEE